jgi:hypothetical protein
VRYKNENLVRKILKGNGKREMGGRCPFSNSNSELELLYQLRILCGTSLS